MKTPSDSLHPKRWWRFSWPLAALALSSCANYTSATKQGFDDFQRRDYDGADAVYSKEADKDGRDQLVYLFDRGTVRNVAGKYEMSIKDFLLADKLSDIKDYTALGTQTATILANDRILQYKGEEFEHVLISVYLALDFAALGKDEEAAVAARQVNRKLELLRDDADRKYDLNAFAQYLAGLLFEKMGNWNFAYVDYKKTYEIDPNFMPVRIDLVRGALWSDSQSDMDKWKKTLGVKDPQIRDINRDRHEKGSVVLLYQNGIGPEKFPNPSFPEIPEYRSRYNRYRAARLYLNGKEVARSEILFNVDQAARENLKEKYASMIAKRVAGIAARTAVAYELDKKEPGLGTLVAIGMGAFSRSQTDLRSWTLLPHDFQVARAEMAPGTYDATLRLEDTSGGLGSPRPLGKVTIEKAGQVALLQYRSLND